MHYRSFAESQIPVNVEVVDDKFQYHEIRERERERGGEMRCGFLLFVFFCFSVLTLHFSFFSFVSGSVFLDIQLYRLVILECCGCVCCEVRERSFIG